MHFLCARLKVINKVEIYVSAGKGDPDVATGSAGTWETGCLISSPVNKLRKVISIGNLN